MSRSNPTVNNPHPAARWLEWDGANGTIRYFDKDVNHPTKPDKKGANVTVAQPFACLVLDETACVLGWHDASGSKIYSNEVKDTRDQPFLVKSFKGGVVANGLYAQIKDRAVAAGGSYHTNVYIAVKDADGNLRLEVIQFGGAALGAWMDFRKAMGKKLYDGAVVINGFNEGRKGAIVFKTPKFAMKDAKPETNAAATKLDAEILQPFLKEYFAKGVSGAAGAAKEQHVEEGHEPSDEELNQDPPNRQFIDEPITEGMEEEDAPF